MVNATLAEFSVTKSADVAVAARKAKILAALANVQKTRRAGLRKAVTAMCRGVLSFGGCASVTYGIGSAGANPVVEVLVKWRSPASDRFLQPPTADSTSEASPTDRPDLAVRRIGELLDEFSLTGWPEPGAVATLCVFAPPELSLSEADFVDWSGFINESQIEDALSRCEQRRKLLASELQAALTQQELVKKTRGDIDDSSLLTMLSLVASKTDNGVAVLDARGRIVWINDAFTDLCAYEIDECRDRTLHEVVTDVSASASVGGQLQDRLNSRSSVHFEFPIRIPDARAGWLRADLTPVFDVDDSIGRWIVLFRDVTQQKQAMDVLAAARESAEDDSRAKSEFLANMSHEIRTPMNAIIGMTELALGTDLTPDQREYLSTVKMSADSLLELLNDILDLSKIEAGKIELDETDFDLAGVVRDALKPLAMRAHSKGLELATRFPMDLPHHLHGDPLRLRQVLMNLVSNAIKFTERGEVVVEFAGPPDSNQRDDESRIELRFTVRDTGIGIPAERLTHIFESFAQVDASISRQFGGTGLGLTITAELLRLMGGQIRVESELGVGSTFYVTVPFGLASEQRQSFAERVEFSREQLEGRTVLVVDDNATNRRILKELLTSWGLRPRVCDRADSAIKELEAAAYHDRPFDLLLIDAMMPETDGFELAAAIRSRGDLRAETLMMLSSADQGDAARRCRELGIATLLLKPVSQSDLLESIVSVLSPTQAVDSGGDISEPAPPRPGIPASTPQTHEELALVPLRILIADDHLSNRVIAERILQQRGHTAAQAANGREVFDRLQKESFDLILMDVQMPELDGLQATAAIREREVSTGAHIPIVALTAHAMKGDREMCLAAGMDAYLSKPLRARELVALVEKLCEPVAVARIGTSAARAVVRAVPGGTPGSESSQGRATESAEVPFDFTMALDRMDGNVDLLTEQMRFFREDAPQLVAQIVEAVEAEDGPQLQSAAHRLKGLVSSYDHDSTIALCLKLEFAGRDNEFRQAPEAISGVRTNIELLSAAIRDFIARTEQA